MRGRGRATPRGVRIDGIVGKSRFLTRLPTHRAILALLSHPCRNCQCIAFCDWTAGCRIRCMPCAGVAHRFNCCCVGAPLSPSVSPRPSLLVITRPKFRLEIVFALQLSASAAHFLTHKTSVSALTHLWGTTPTCRRARCPTRRPTRPSSGLLKGRKEGRMGNHDDDGTLFI